MPTLSQEPRLVPQGGTMIGCIYEEPNPDYEGGPNERGILLWLREQARQAEADPNREWHGFRAEFDQLLAGTHPDPHPEKIILGKVSESFDPTTLADPEYEIHACDGLSRYSVTRQDNADRTGYPLNSQQLFAALCGEHMDRYLFNAQAHPKAPFVAA